jgi:NTE family protein
MSDPSPRVADLVLEGGGVKGTALAGACAALEQAGYRLNRIAGTSAGALFGALVAAGIPAAALHQRLLDMDYRTLLDPTLWKRLPIPLVDDALAELAEQALYRGDALHDLVESELRAVNVHTFGDLRIDDAGMDPAVDAERRYKLVVVVSDLTRQRMVRVPWYVRRDYGIDPDSVAVADAVRMSTAIPFFYKPFRLRSRITGEESLMVDGGVTDSFPIHIFDRTDGRPPRWPTFYIGLSAELPPDRRVAEPSGIADFVRALVLTGMSGRDNAELELPPDAMRAVHIDTSYVDPLDFGIDRATRQRLYDDGFAAVERFLETFSFSSYRQVWTRPAAS